MDEVPDRPIADLETTLGQLGHQTTQAEVPLANALSQPRRMRVADRSRLVPAHLSRRGAASLPEPPHPVDRRAHADAEPRRRRMPRQTFLLNRGNNPFPQIHR